MKRDLIHFFPEPRKAVSIPIGLSNGQLYVVIPFETIDDGAQIEYITPTSLHSDKILNIKIKLNLDENSGSSRFKFFTILFKNLPKYLNLVQLRVEKPSSATIPKYSIGPMILVDEPSVICTYNQTTNEFDFSTVNLARSEQELFKMNEAKFGPLSNQQATDSCTIPPFP